MIRGCTIPNLKSEHVSVTFSRGAYLSSVANVHVSRTPTCIWCRSDVLTFVSSHSMDPSRAMSPTLSTNDSRVLILPKVRARSLELSIPPVSELGHTTPGSPPIPESPTARSRRCPLPDHSPAMHLTSTPLHHTLDVSLPKDLLPEMVTVSAKRGHKLDIVADIWHQEKDSHYEWEIVFPPRDVDMSSIRVDLADGHLTIRARRLQRRTCTA